MLKKCSVLELFVVKCTTIHKILYNSNLSNTEVLKNAVFEVYNAGMHFHYKGLDLDLECTFF